MKVPVHVDQQLFPVKTSHKMYINFYQNTYFNMLAIRGFKERLFLALNAECYIGTVDNVTPVTTAGEPLTILT